MSGDGRPVGADGGPGGRTAIVRTSRPALLARRLVGRRLSDPVDMPTDPDVLAVRGRLAAISVRASLFAGAWVGFAIGLVVGALVGALIVWFAGAVLSWQADLSFTFGVTRRLLPFGDQLGLLREMQSRWWLVIVIAALASGVVSALLGGLLGGILAAAYNRSPRHALVVVELPSGVAVYPLGGASLAADPSVIPAPDAAAAGSDGRVVAPAVAEGSVPARSVPAESVSAEQRDNE